MLAGTFVPKPKAWQWRHLSCSSTPPLQPPTSREVHVWCLFSNEIHQASLLRLYESYLPSEERTHVRLAKNKKVQKEYLLTRILARTLLARYTGELVDPSALTFEKNKLGKPHIVWPSHTTGASQVGIDVEEKDRETRTNLIRFARRKYSETEAEWLEGLDDFEAQRTHFLRLWTLKESYGKALGNGIAGTILRDATFTFDECALASVLGSLTGIKADKQISQIRSNHANVWQFVLFQLTNAHFASVCVQRSESLPQELIDVEPLHLKIMKTIPLVKDEPLLDAVALGLSI